MKSLIMKNFIIVIGVLTLIGNAYADMDKLVSCIIKVESNGDPHAVGEHGEIGLMQINYCVLLEFNKEFHTWSDGWSYVSSLEGSYIQKTTDHGYPYGQKLYKPIKSTQLFDWEINRMIGIWYLNRLKDHYLKEHYTLERLLAAYNGGITRLRKLNYNVSKMPKSTREYIKKVLRCYK